MSRTSQEGLQREEAQELEEPEECPDCQQRSVYCASGGGVKCKTPGCGYWECY